MAERRTGHLALGVVWCWLTFGALCHANAAEQAEPGTAMVAATDAAIVATLRTRFESRTEADPLVVLGKGLLAPEALTRFYRARDYAPVWKAGEGAGGPRTFELRLALEDARIHGLDPAAYDTELIAALETRVLQPSVPDAFETPAEAAADLELIATDAFLRHALHRAHGRIVPRTVDPDWFLFVEEVDPATLLNSLAALEQSGSIGTLLDSLWPSVPEYWRLIEEKRRLLARMAPSPVAIASGRTMKLGQRDARVPELRARLGLPLLTDDLFDADVDAAIRLFQQGQGIPVDGVAGANTLDLLNLDDAGRIARIDVNLERWRWLMRVLPATRVQVNVADYFLQAFDRGHEALRMNVIVGAPYRRTPIFTEPMRYLVFNPDWQVPRKIAVQDKLPLLHKNPQALAAQGYEARRAGSADPMRPVDAFEWETVTRGNFNYLLRQRPGPTNALGSVKFILPNPYAIYLHDTPTRALFARTGRAFSSGCIRLESPMTLADWVLRDQPDWTRERIDAVVAAGNTISVPLLAPVPVLMLYFTVVAGESGTVYYRPDPYGRDKRIVAVLARTRAKDGADPGAQNSVARRAEARPGQPGFLALNARTEVL